MVVEIIADGRHGMRLSLVAQLGWILPLHLLNVCVIYYLLSVNFGAVLVVVGQRGMYFLWRKIEVSGDLVDRHFHLLIPSRHVDHADASPGDARLAAAYAWLRLDKAVERFG